MRRRSMQLVPLLLWLMIGFNASVSAAQDSLFDAFVFDTRADLEALANLVLGEGVRPDDWTFNTDVASPTVVADLWFDNEQLADTIFGVEIRPADWFGASGSNARIIARNARHDLELAADQAIGVTVRPPEWRGAAPILKCDRSVQNVVELLNRFFTVQPTTPESVLDYCRSVIAEFEDDLVEVVFTSDQLSQLPNLILAIRGDLERLADERLGLNNRPAGWIGNRSADSPTLTGDTFLDLELLADTLLGTGERPSGWIGGVTNLAATSYLNLRHDLESLADEALGVNQRPTGWQGEDPILRCDPLVQNLVFLVQQNYNFSRTGFDPASPDYCVQLAVAANVSAENPPVLDVVETEGDDRLTAESNYAFSYLDVAATEYMGIMPGGVEFRAWYRNFGGSDMMFVSGDDFALYVDYHFTTLSPIIFDSLPTTEGISPLTFCNAAWCNGPGPTPTPTGFGPLAAVINQATPPATVAAPPELGGIETKVQVSWNNIRVTYLLDNAEARTAQVALELCRQPAQNATTCEPVLNVMDTATNTPKQPISTYNGLNVYEFRYGYTTQVLIEGATTFSNDVWISDPTIR